MTMIGTLLNKESIRNQKMIFEYEKELSLLPKGSIQGKNVGNKVYYYLNYRDGKKVISKYIGKDKQALIPIKEKLERRIQIENMLKKLKEEQMQIKKMEALLWFCIMEAIWL